MPSSSPADASGRSGASSVVPLARTADDIPTVIGRSPLPADGLPLSAGYRLGAYEIVGPLGAGGMAAVYQARDTELGRLVALKILPPDSTLDPDAVARFKLEARAAAKLDHDNVARVFAYGEDDGKHYIAFEYVEGETLKALIDRHGKVPLTDAVRYLLQTAAGVQHAADRGVVHRDIKPSNIVVTTGGVAKLIDMGLARHYESTADGGVTQSGVTLGTFDYISPEQALDPRQADTRSDIYSLGCTFYHALTGVPPVPGGTAARKLHAHRHEAPADPRLYNPEVSRSLASVLGRMIVKDPAERFQSATELIAALSSAASQHGVPVELGSTRSAVSLPQLEPNGLSRRTIWSLAISGVLVLVAATVVWNALSNRTPNTPPPLWTDAPTTKPAAVGDLTLTDVRPVVPSARVTVETTAELLAAVAAGSTNITLKSDATFDLTATDGLVLRGAKVTLASDDSARPAVVKVSAEPLPFGRPAGLRNGAITFAKCDEVQLRGVRFVLSTPPAETEDPGNPVGIVAVDVGKFQLAECTFEPDAKPQSSDGTGVYVLRTTTLPTDFTAASCTFALRNWTGIELAGPMKATISECGFATSRSGIELTAEAGDPAAPVRIENSTLQLSGTAAAVTANPGASGDVTLGYCVLAAPTPVPGTGMMAETESRPALARGAIRVTAKAGEPSAVFRVDVPGGFGDTRIELPQSPWLIPRLDPDRPWKQFELNPAVRSLRVASVGILGVRHLPVEKAWLYDPWPPAPLAAELPRPGVKVWYPAAPADERDRLPPNVYAELEAAVAALKDGDVLEIRGSGRVEVPAVRFEKAGLRCTIRAAADSAPILVPRANTNKADLSLFRLDDGELILDGLDIRLDVKGDAERRSVSVVAVSGGQACELRNCVVTLDETGDERAAVVSLVDVSGQMMKKDAVRKPGVRLENCLVRGRGRVVWAAALVPADVTVSNTAVAVTGPAFDFGPAEKPPMNGTTGLYLTRVTAVLGGPLLDLRSARSTDDKAKQVGVTIRADGSLFVPVEAAASPLLNCTGVDPIAAKPLVSWESAGGNAFANVARTGTLAEFHAGDTATEASRLDRDDWLKWSGEPTGAFGRATLAGTWSTTARLLAARPADFEMKENDFDDLTRTGAKWRLLPKPGVE